LGVGSQRIMVVNSYSFLRVGAEPSVRCKYQLALLVHYTGISRVWYYADDIFRSKYVFFGYACIYRRNRKQIPLNYILDRWRMGYFIASCLQKKKLFLCYKRRV
jgi:hypothetical protein